MGAPLAVQWSGLHDADAVDAWDRLRSPGRWDTVFGEAAYLEAISSNWNCEIEQVTILAEGGPAAAARLAVRRLFGLAYVVIPPLTAYSAIRLGSDPGEAEIHDRTSILESLLEAVERRFYAAALHLPPPIQDLRPFTWRGWGVRPLYTYHIRLDSAHDPMDAWSESARRMARQQSQEFEIVSGEAAMQARWVVESYERNGRKPPLTEERLAAVAENLKRDGLATTYAARNLASKEIEASVTVLRNDDTAYYWAAGSRPGPSMTVLLASLLPLLASDGVTLFDFIGANTASIAEFKRRFGGQLTTYFRAVRRRGAIGRILGSRS